MSIAKAQKTYTHLLEVNGLKTYFKTDAGIVKAVDGISFTLDQGETLGIVGESGSGKSVTNLSIMRLIQSPPGKIVDGEILFEGEDVLKLSESELRHIRGNEISMIFQDPMTSLNPILTVGEQIAEVLVLHKKDFSGEQVEARVDEILTMVGISPDR